MFDYPISESLIYLIIHTYCESPTKSLNDMFMNSF